MINLKLLKLNPLSAASPSHCPGSPSTATKVDTKSELILIKDSAVTDTDTLPGLGWKGRGGWGLGTIHQIHSNIQ